MTDGFLNDLGLDQVEADPNHIADGKYPAHVFTSEVRTKKDGVSKSWVITYKIDKDAPRHAGMQQQEWFDLNPQGDNAELKKSFLKRRVLSLGVPESKINSFNPGDVVGTAVGMTIVHKNGYQNVGNVDLAEGNTTGTITAATPVVSDLL